MRDTLSHLTLLCSLLLAVPCLAQNTDVTEPSTSKLWGQEGELWDPEGLLKDFTNAGYRQGAEIPNRPVTTNVEDFGANGQDEEDDTDAFRAAIRAVPEDGVIFIPNGTYIITDYIHVSGKGPGGQDSRWPGNHFTIYNKSNFTLRGEDMFKTRIFFPKRLLEIYPIFSKPGVIREVHHNHERYNNDAFKKKYGFPLEYDFSKKKGGIDFVITGEIRGKLIDGLKHEYSQWFTMGGSFFEFKDVKETHVENLSFLFDDRQRWEHQENTGGNPISWIAAENCYGRNIYIRNSDSGIFNIRVKNHSILNVILDQYPGRFCNQFGTSGHNGIKLVGAQDSLVHNVWFTGSWHHDFDLNGSNSGTVISNVKGTWVDLTYHGGFHANNLYTAFEANNGRFIPTKKHKSETYWGIKTQKPLRYHSGKVSRNLKDVVVGVNTDQPSDIESGIYWNETINPWKLEPFNIYLAQMQKRGKPLPTSMTFSRALLPLKPGEGHHLYPTETASVRDGKTKKGESTRDMNFQGGNIVRTFKDDLRYVYLKFDLAELGIEGIEKVTLEFFNDNMFARSRAGEADQVTVDYVKQDDWKDHEITFVNQPTETSGTSTTPFTDKKEWSVLDVTSFARDAFQDDKIITLKVGLKTNAGIIHLSKKRTGRPRLIVVPSPTTP